MASHSSELAQFHQFVAQQLAHGDPALTPEECLDDWRAMHPSAKELGASKDAIERGLEQARRGEGKPLSEFAQEFRDEMGFSQRDA